VRARPFLAIGLGLALPTLAGAYPQFIAKGYTNCITCHYSPTGGGLPNSYGHAATEATFPDQVSAGWVKNLRQILAKRDVTGEDEAGKPAFHYDAGLDSRLLLTQAPREPDATGGMLLIPMLAEVGGVAAYGPVLAYLTGTVRPSGAGGHGYGVISREHWLGWKMTPGHMLRAGRLVLPFGIRTADHTQYVREDFGFDKYDQWYGLEWDYSPDWMMASVAVFDGTLIGERIEPGERGIAGSVAFHLLPSTLSVGLSVLGARSDYVNHFAGSLFGRWKAWDWAYAMAEIAASHRALRSGEGTQDEVAGHLRVGTFPLGSLDVYGELGARRIGGAWELTKVRYALGADWKALPWVEVSPAYLLEEDVEAGLKGTFLTQLHLFW
jgi:hypothetical protein